MKELMTVPEVAKIFHVSEETIRRWSRLKKIPTKRYGNKWLFNYAKITGEKSEQEAKELLGKKAIRQNPGYSFDILLENKRIEVKSSSLRDYRNGWCFSDVNILDIYPDGKSNGFKNDYVLFMCYDNDYQYLLRAYCIPTKKIEKYKKGGSFSINIDNKLLEKYRVFKGGNNVSL